MQYAIQVAVLLKDLAEKFAKTCKFVEIQDRLWGFLSKSKILRYTLAPP